MASSKRSAAGSLGNVLIKRKKDNKRIGLTSSAAASPTSVTGSGHHQHSHSQSFSDKAQAAGNLKDGSGGGGGGGSGGGGGISNNINNNINISMHINNNPNINNNNNNGPAGNIMMMMDDRHEVMMLPNARPSKQRRGRVASLFGDDAIDSQVLVLPPQHTKSLPWCLYPQESSTLTSYPGTPRDFILINLLGEFKLAAKTKINNTLLLGPVCWRQHMHRSTTNQCTCLICSTDGWVDWWIGWLHLG
jgi:hypothetical protein